MKKKIRILGWRTPKTPANATFGMVMARYRGHVNDVPESATVVFAFDMDEAEPKLLELTRADLANYIIV